MEGHKIHFLNWDVLWKVRKAFNMFNDSCHWLIEACMKPFLGIIWQKKEMFQEFTFLSLQSYTLGGFFFQNSMYL